MTFDTLHIHQDTAALLKSGITEGRIPHAQFIGSVDGGGALPLAVAYAHALLSEGAEADMFGGVDDRAARLEHPDLHIVFPRVQGTKEHEKVCQPFVNDFKEAYRSNPFLTYAQWKDMQGESQKKPIISATEAGAIAQRLSLQSYEGGRKVLIIWMPELMNAACSNKMLKLIEEPRPGTVLLLVGQSFDELLPTVKSRLQAITLPKLSEEEVGDFLAMYRSEQDEVIDQAAAHADGSIGKALAALGERADDPGEEVVAWVRLCWKRNIRGISAWSDAQSKKGRMEVLRMLERANNIFRSSFRIHYLQNAGEPKDDVAEFTMKFAPFVHADSAALIMECIDKAHSDIAQNGNSRIVLMDSSFELMKCLAIKSPEN